MSTTWLTRAGLIEEGLPSSSGGDSRIDHFVEDFDALFNRMSGSSSATLGTSVNSNRPHIVPVAKGKLPISSFGGSRGTLATDKRKLGSLFMDFGDLMEGELDPVANKQISHLADYFLYSSECISTDMAMEVDKLDLNKHYSRAFKACHDAEVERLQGKVRLS